MAPVLFCFGLGYSAEVLASRLAAQGWHLAGTSRDPAKVAAWQAQGIDAQVFGAGTSLARPEVLSQAQAILISVAPDTQGCPVLAQHHGDLAKTQAWLGYLSTTGVYGDYDGTWVDEDAPRRATSPRGLARIKAEDQWQALGAHLFRLAGIYGPGRSALDNVREGSAKRIVKPGQVFSRIHVEDIANVLESSLQHPKPGRAYNVADDEPAPPQDVVAYAAKLLGVSAPPEEPFEVAAQRMSPMALSFYADNKRITNTRIKTELGVRLTYPTYREGLSACLSSTPR